jgi:hypothetical protein
METQNSTFAPINTTATNENMFSYIIKQKNKNVIIVSSDEESDSESKVNVPPPRPTKVRKLKGSKNDPIPLDDSDEEMQDVTVDAPDPQLSQSTQVSKDLQLPPSTQESVKEEVKHRDLLDYLVNHDPLTKQEELLNSSKSQVDIEVELPSDSDDMDAMLASGHSPALLYSPLSDFATISDITESESNLMTPIISNPLLEETMSLDTPSSEAMIIVSKQKKKKLINLAD